MADQPIAGGKQTVVEEGTQFKGSLTSTCPILVNGRIEGDIDTPALAVSATGSVKGTVKVGQVHSQGEIEGEFDAETVRLAGRVRDNTVIRTKSLEVKLTSETHKMQVVFGECELAVGDVPVDEPRKKKRDIKGPGSEVPPPVGDGGGGIGGVS
jgi:cytoskeletal protein CcmA (bactofilin family)